MIIASNKITQGQFICLVFSYLSGFSTLFLSEAKLLKQDVWMSCCLGMCPAIIVVWIFYRVQLKYPALTMVEIFDKLCGHWMTKLILIIYLVYILEMMAAACRALSSFYTSVALPNMPSDQLILLIILSTTYATYLGIGTIVRSVQLTLPFFLVGIIIIFLFLWREVETNPLLPPFQHTVSAVVYGGLLSSYFPFGKTVVFGFLLSRVHAMEKTFSAAVKGILFSGLYLLIASYLTLGALGINLAGSVTFPFFSAIQMVKFGEYVERIEITIICIWTMFTIFEIVVLQYVFVLLFRHIFRLKNAKRFIFPIGVLFFVIAQKSFLRMNDLAVYNLTIAPFSTLLPIIIIPVVIGLLAVFKGREPA
jgi:spore germination protein (amino acid permease)